VSVQALSLVQAASRGSSGSVLKVINSSSDSGVAGSLVVLCGVTRSRVAAALWTLYNPLPLSLSLSEYEYDEVQSDCSDGCASLHDPDEVSEARSAKRLKASTYQCATCSNSEKVDFGPKLPHFRLLNSGHSVKDNDNDMNTDTDRDRDSNVIERYSGILDQLGLSYCPLDSSFEDAALLCPTGSSRGQGHSDGPGHHGSGFIPVLQGAQVDDTCAGEGGPSLPVGSLPVGAVSVTRLQPTRSNCHFALLLLPAVYSSASSSQVDAFGKCSDEPVLRPKIALRSTGSVAYVQLGD
jgi:hypothetical protein